ncbi:hypothetical protein ECANGB1_2629 [Enterospora canceri]|uniref:Uncharacterized protein n=1 Tax=Enterospora canceri TaxID=1081671 RepID=A0A1Y1S9C2_9MICR|nr:hypothetical protein ECANGB1_2629 [Enterospora canceri]
MRLIVIFNSLIFSAASNYSPEPLSCSKVCLDSLKNLVLGLESGLKLIYNIPKERKGDLEQSGKKSSLTTEGMKSYHVILNQAKEHIERGVKEYDGNEEAQNLLTQLSSKIVELETQLIIGMEEGME